MTPPSASSPQVDNSHLPLKLDLRRRLLAPFAETHPLVVMDCCAGQQRIWNTLRDEFPLAGYLGLDVKPGLDPSVVTADSARWLRQVGVGKATVIDVDTYGEPWEHYAAIIAAPWQSPDILVFLTIGMGLGALGAISKAALGMAGLKPEWSLLIPRGMAFRAILLDACLASALDHQIEIVEAFRAYSPDAPELLIGLHLRRKDQA